MCGIVGIFDTRAKREINRDLLHRMNESQHHRGPDEGGLHIEPGVGLGHRRLSIIDLSSGQQPLYNEDQSVVVVYNGEIYNFQYLAKALKKKGHIFQTHSDTEVIVHAWEEWGDKCVEQFRGMFAFAVWDRNRQELFLARDRLGIKPLYYAILQDGCLIFGSELKSILMHPNLKHDLDPRAVDDYFAFGYIPEPKTIFSNAHKLSPGHTLHIKRGYNIPKPKIYWDIPFQPVGIANEREAAEELIQRLREAVDIRLVSDVPLGAFLSGGVDSSAVVAMMAMLKPDEPVNTCSIGFNVEKYNETEYAQLVADRYSTNHRSEQVDPDDFSLIDELVNLYDEPFADSSAMPTYRVCQLAKKRVTVALSGDGGDENLAGYRRYRWHVYEDRMRSLLPANIRKPLFGTAARLYPKADWAPKWLRAKSTMESISKDNIEGYFHSVSILGDSQRRKLFTNNFHNQLQGYQAADVLRDHARRSPVSDPLSLVQYLDLKTYLVGDILTKVDRASMAHSLEVRVPILDHHLVEWMSGLNTDYKLRGKEGKYLLKKGLEPYLPNNVLYRPKMGFSVPLDRWFKGPLKERVRSRLLTGALNDSGIFDHRFINNTIDQHQSGTREGSAVIWSLLVFESFLRKEM